MLDRARELTGINQTTELVHAGLGALIAREAARRLAAMGGTMPNLKATRRRRSRPRPAA